ncbi:twin transmembrane helix small protein [Roseomonas marmotae]|uniref:Twin transmembrane helix small protein n=1 Tax=Roseomonas marmotae TaxID=2768161 RepID=A0ABS3K7E1_9PROT|nr:twin transmembrane helix small protein [Roseomonas marmotae]MBO1073394.1 twin transmembrane helix small protein [Roseomonas marmotae]QTI80407.1 twin transmembrane helix small protein [Roseomonas marmotae]
MQTAVTVLLVIVMLATLGTLFAGMLGLARGEDGAKSNRLMRWRVMLQGLAVALFVLLLLISRH